MAHFNNKIHHIVMNHSAFMFILKQLKPPRDDDKKKVYVRQT